MATVIKCNALDCANNDDGQCTKEEIEINEDSICEQEDI